ncbi:hypothetical protein A0Y63_00100 [Campylobacter lari]|nr:hypothetical protein [Campylobacter lari]EAK9890078.1 hypothetical protein [Campylobacter lari]
MVSNFPSWGDEYCLGNEKIDLQHQRFFALTLEVFRLSNRHIYKTELKKSINGVIFIYEKSF